MQVFHTLVRAFEECIIVFEEALLIEYLKTFIMQTILTIVQGVQLLHMLIMGIMQSCYYHFLLNKQRPEMVNHTLNTYVVFSI